VWYVPVDLGHKSGKENSVKSVIRRKGKKVKEKRRRRNQNNRTGVLSAYPNMKEKGGIVFQRRVVWDVVVMVEVLKGQQLLL
jgi:hypothetical protein